MDKSNQCNKDKMRKIQINEITDETTDFTTITTEIKRIVRNYYEELFANKLDKRNG